MIFRHMPLGEEAGENLYAVWQRRNTPTDMDAL
jgi:hypothetical protein